jgi:glycine/D-amino acid oxidase-like deaminating enzyme
MVTNVLPLSFNKFGEISRTKKMLPYHKLSYWEKTSYLEGNNVTIIGSGIVGLTTAILTKQKLPKHKILVMERGYLPSGASTKNAGFACFGSPTEIFDDLKHIPENEVWETVQMRFEGLTKLFEIVPPSLLDYQQCGSWDLCPESQEDITPAFLSYVNEQIQKITKVSDVYYEDLGKIQSCGFSGFEKAFGNRLEGSIDTGKLMEQLHLKCILLGIKFLQGAEVLSIHNQANQVEMETNFGRLVSEKVIVCTNGFAKQLLDLEVEPARAQVLVTSPIPSLPWEGTFHFDQGYYYFRNVGNRILFGGGRNLDFTGENTTEMETTEAIQSHLEHLLRTKIIPGHAFEIAYQWAGIMGIGQSKKPIVTVIDKNLMVGVRMGGMGVAIGAMIGEQLSQKIVNEQT